MNSIFYCCFLYFDLKFGELRNVSVYRVIGYKYEFRVKGYRGKVNEMKILL